MASRWHRRTAVAIGTVAIVSVVVGGGPVVLKAVQQYRREQKLIGKWEYVRESSLRDWRGQRLFVVFRDGRTFSWLNSEGKPIRGMSGTFTASEVQLVLTLGAEHQGSLSELTYGLLSNGNGAFVLEYQDDSVNSELDTTYRLKRVEPEDSNAVE